MQEPVALLAKVYAHERNDEISLRRGLASGPWPALPFAQLAQKLVEDSADGLFAVSGGNRPGDQDILGHAAAMQNCNCFSESGGARPKSAPTFQVLLFNLLVAELVVAVWGDQLSRFVGCAIEICFHTYTKEFPGQVVGRKCENKKQVKRGQPG